MDVSLIQDPDWDLGNDRFFIRQGDEAGVVTIERLGDLYDVPLLSGLLTRAKSSVIPKATVASAVSAAI